MFVCPDAQAALALAQEADEAMTGRIGVMGTPAEHWYHAGRDHIFFAVEADIYHGDLSALALPATAARAARAAHRNTRAGARARHPPARDADQAEEGMIDDRPPPPAYLR